jgi:hypothetical protein
MQFQNIDSGPPWARPLLPPETAPALAGLHCHLRVPTTGAAGAAQLTAENEAAGATVVRTTDITES